MATILSTCGPRPIPVEYGAADRGPGTPRPGPSVLQALAVGGRRLLGAVLLLLGILMMSTLVLLPVGLPLALFAVALIAAPGSP